MSALLDVALLHYPVRDRAGATVTTAVTNLDVHDIARSSCTFGVGRYYIVTPIEAQHVLVRRITEHWTTGAGRRRMPERHEALELCAPMTSLEEALADATQRHGSPPKLIATAARGGARTPTTFAALRATLQASTDPYLLMFGTGHGLADALLERADVLLEPIAGAGSYNHLSVRAAAAIVLDRLLGR